MTLDQIFLLLADSKFLRANRKERVASMSAEEVHPLVQEDGTIRGRDRDGNPLSAKILGTSKAERARIAEEERLKSQPPKKKRKRY